MLREWWVIEQWIGSSNEPGWIERSRISLGCKAVYEIWGGELPSADGCACIVQGQGWNVVSCYINIVLLCYGNFPVAWSYLEKFGTKYRNRKLLCYEPYHATLPSLVKRYFSCRARSYVRGNVILPF